MAVLQAGQAGPWNSSHPRNWIVAVAFCLLGLRIVAHARGNSVGWLLLVMGGCAAATVASDTWASMPLVAWVGKWIWWPTYALLPVAALVFPDGRLRSRRWLPVLVLGILSTMLGMVGFGWASWTVPTTFWNEAVQGSAKRGWPFNMALAGVAGAAVSVVAATLCLVLRWRQALGKERRLVFWALVWTLLMILAVTLEAQLTMWGAWAVGAAALPIAALIAIMRYGLYDIDLVVHRSLLYGLLTMILVAAYATVVLAATATLPTYAHLFGTVAVVLGLGPLHRALSNRLDHWLYGDSANPYAALSRLTTYLDNPVPLTGVFAAVAKAATEALKLPYVAVRINSGQQPQVLGEHGRSRQWPQFRAEISHRGDVLGELVAEARSPEEPLGRRERRLLAELARQAAPSVRAEQLSQELQRATDRFVREREENLRRIVLDFHDTVGAGLAGTVLQVDAALKLMDGSDRRVERRLSEVIRSIRYTSQEARQLVRGVWCSDLHHGLLDAVKRLAERFRCARLDVQVIADGQLGRLPAAVELAAYRIAGEALANIAKHARANSCWIRLHRAVDLELAVEDNGAGLSSVTDKGIGLASMRARCEELRGTFTFESSSFGTTILVRLPIDDPVDEISTVHALGAPT